MALITDRAQQGAKCLCPRLSAPSVRWRVARAHRPGDGAARGNYGAISCMLRLAGICVGRLALTQSGDTGRQRADASDISGELRGASVSLPCPPRNKCARPSFRRTLEETSQGSLKMSSLTALGSVFRVRGREPRGAGRTREHSISPSDRPIFPLYGTRLRAALHLGSLMNF